MNINNINSEAIREIILSMAANLEKNKNMVDALNVFPVPDGDTGTNMHLTIQSAVKEATEYEYTDARKAVKAAANGSLMGARGNSGVILSQLLRGFSEGFKDKEEISTKVIAEALKSASDTAYNAVMKPVEGTILTVARESAEKAIEIYAKYEKIVDFLEIVVEHAKDALRRTPEMLDVLKQAGVVDAGGQGLVFLMEGALLYLKGEKIEAIDVENVEIKDTEDELGLFLFEEDIKFAYCTEFIINKASVEREKFLDIIKNKGDSIVCIKNDDIIKVHIHTNEPGYVLDRAGQYGELINIKIDNMRKQFRDKQKSAKPMEKKKDAFISIGMGEGVKKVFEELGVDIFISGGQTMNPSTEDIMKAVDSVNSDNIFILPNNSNIILAANQAKEISDKNIFVIPTKTIPQGIAAMIAYNPEIDETENEVEMLNALANVKTGQVTYAVRDTVVNDMEIKKDNIITIHDGKIISNGEDKKEETLNLLKEMIDEDSYLITLIYGEEVDKKEAEEIAAEIEEYAEDCDIELISGGQPLYYYIVSVE
ncbi:hypothetical protein SAMN02745751_00919 [Dethiosulfatibacter aminovorans DSM 17477]|uniref:DhaL domain-containing protein n=1 Tax=Dethiosulfatibacter aminovorans DSM 17477 TaxID=1121476 RepID=A0A1M6DHS5_9FIRM|nr:DAK2 domain-containing protein [Dethiosulfatibacter aminovorans]SHI72730.1 hypothetical protein SAMN02745751_00919 [Dethiosulfatibacter aminovorans DSM 17477]